MINKVGIVSLGCSKNRVDTENILGILKNNGFTITNDAASADIIIINTCGFIVDAKQESINTILEMAQYKEKKSCKLLVVVGCLSQRYQNELEEALPEVDLFWGVKDHHALVKRIMELANVGMEFCGDKARMLTTPPYRAYLRIADGCDNKCTYCAIPLIRGGRVSVPMEELIDEAKELAKNGVKELTVIAQDTSAYGMDIYGCSKLPELLDELAKIEELVWIRVLYTYPDTVDEKLIDTMIRNEKVVNYIDIPVQHIDNDILTAMNRRGTGEHIRHIIEYARQKAPDFVIRSTVIVGFPGESEAQFETLADFVQNDAFDRLGVFAYSCEDGTAAALMENQTDEAVKQYRAEKIMALQRNVSRKYNEKRLSSEVVVLVEGIENGRAYGRSYAEAAEVDGVIVLNKGDLAVGEFVKAKITKASDYDLQGEVI